jgi:hypothetical protein
MHNKELKVKNKKKFSRFETLKFFISYGTENQ